MVLNHTLEYCLSAETLCQNCVPNKNIISALRSNAKMSFMGLSSDVEIKTIQRSGSTVEELYKAYNFKMEEEGESEIEETDITVPIIEMHSEESNEGENESLHLNQIQSKISEGNELLRILQNGRTETYLNKIMLYGNCNKTTGKTQLSSEETNKKLHRCNICGAGFRIKHSITKHKRELHGIDQFRCMFCHKSYPLKRNLLDHIMSHKGPHGFRCSICNKVRPNYISIQRHVKTHSQKKIPCLQCGALFKTKWELKSHEFQHNKDRQFKCEHCELQFANPTKLREHATQHSTGKRFKCDLCDKEFNAQKNLTNHKKLHFDKKPFKCQYCSLAFRTSSAKQKHVPIHNKEKRKPYSCQDCDKKYTSTTSLAVHRMKFHSGEQSFNCPYCKQTFNSKSAVAEHVTEHAAERPHSCQRCLCRYKNKRELRRHQREKKHYESKSEGKGKQILYKTTLESLLRSNYTVCGGTLRKEKEDDSNTDKEEGEEEEEEGWEMPEPEVCIKVAESDEDEQKVKVNKAIPEQP